MKANIVFVAGCILCPMFQASNESSWNTDIINHLVNYNVNIIALPCPETLFFGVKDAPLRGKHGFDYYSSNDEFVSHCKKLAIYSSDVIQKYIDAGYVISMIVGIENSPTCAVNYMYTHLGMKNIRGIYIEELYNDLYVKGHDIPFVGVNRQHTRKSIKKISMLLNGSGVV